MSQAPSFCDVVSARSEKYHADFAVPDSAYLYEREIAEVGAELRLRHLYSRRGRERAAS